MSGFGNRWSENQKGHVIGPQLFYSLSCFSH